MAYLQSNAKENRRTAVPFKFKSRQTIPSNFRQNLTRWCAFVFFVTPALFVFLLNLCSSSFPVCWLTCLPSLETTSNESLCHPPKVSTKRGMNTIPSASHRLLYFPILMFKECGTPLPPSSNFSNKFLNWSEMISCKKDFYSLQQKQMVFYNHFQNLQQYCPKGQFAQCTSGTTRCKKVVWRDNFQTISSWFGNSFLINSEFTLILWARLV